MLQRLRWDGMGWGERSEVRRMHSGRDKVSGTEQVRQDEGGARRNHEHSSETAVNGR